MGETAGENVCETYNALWSKDCAKVVLDGMRGPKITRRPLPGPACISLPLGEHALGTKTNVERLPQPPASTQPWRYAATWAQSVLKQGTRPAHAFIVCLCFILNP